MYAGLGETRRPQTGLAHAAVQRSHLDFTGETESLDFAEIDSRRALYDEIATAVDVEQRVERWDVVVRVEPSPTGSPARRVGEHEVVAADGRQRGGATQRHVADVVLGHGQPDLVDIAAHPETGRLAQRCKFGADRTCDVVHGRA